ncbi:MAG: glycosyltransferase family 2 protein, partial [Planctomycetota bacterium]
MGKGSVSVILPCLDEERTVAACVLEARQGIQALDREGEVLVVDNGSTDGSVRMAEAAGARVVIERRRGYGAALHHGIREARGEILLLGDADGSYDFEHLAPLVDAVEKGADLVVGSRLRGRMEPGAMPWVHRRVGTPLLTFLVNRLFGTRLSDVNGGQRALRAEAARRLDLRAAGMEFASEMVIKAALARMRVAEVPVEYRKDARGRPSHLRRWRDGWRHLRFILLFAPNVVLVAPGVALSA